jgi:hypothetical protein
VSDEDSPAEEAGAGASLTEEAGETTAADMVSGPANTRPVGEGTMVKVGEASDSEKEGGQG